MNAKSVIPVETQRGVTRRDTNPLSFLQQEEDITGEIANGVPKATVRKPVPKQTKQIEIKTAA